MYTYAIGTEITRISPAVCDQKLTRSINSSLWVKTVYTKEKAGNTNIKQRKRVRPHQGRLSSFPIGGKYSDEGW